jgi:hypothetical protein
MNTIPTYTAPNPRTKCNDKSVNAKGLQYTPTKAGPDEIEVEFIDSGGFRSATKFVIASNDCPLSIGRIRFAFVE